MSAGNQDDGQSDTASSSMSPTEQTTATKTVSTPHLPFDLVSDILCRLSVKQLLQLCCVCKPWNSLISLDSKFAKKQLSLSTSNKDRHDLFLSSISSSSREFLLCHSSISSFFSSASIVTVKQLSQTLTGVLNNQYSRPEITSCDGILCFGIDESLAVLYNPSTRKSKVLPPLKNPNQKCFLNLYTLVYDPIIKNYKIIAIVFLGNSKIEVNIHTLGTDYWRRIQDFPYSRLICRPGIFVNNTVNWFAVDTVIVSLDIEKESYQKLSPPSFDDDTGSEVSVSLGVLRGCLSLLSLRDKSSNVWIMKEYGNEKSWTKLFTVPHMEEGRFYCYVKVLYISEDDKLLMEFFKPGKYDLIVYDSINNTFSIPTIQNNIHDHKVAPLFYVESLISPF